MAEEPLVVAGVAGPALLDATHELLGRFTAGDRRDQIAFTTAVAELVGNVIEHARPGQGREVVTAEVRLRRDGDDLVAEVDTDGRTLPADLLDAHGVGELPPDWTAEDGRGLAMIQHLAELTLRPRVDGNSWIARRVPGGPRPSD